MSKLKKSELGDWIKQVKLPAQGKLGRGKLSSDIKFIITRAE